MSCAARVKARVSCSFKALPGLWHPQMQLGFRVYGWSCRPPEVAGRLNGLCIGAHQDVVPVLVREVLFVLQEAQLHACDSVIVEL